MKPRRNGFTLIELLIVLVLIGVLATIALLFLWHARERAYVAAMQQDLKTVATQQELYFSRTLTYATNPTDLVGYGPSHGVSISVTYAQTDGWAAVATHASLAASQCGVFTGNATATDAPPAIRAGVINCN
jgi:prepilin-type N-terminal cleavage/methylation domain-containing protein